MVAAHEFPRAGHVFVFILHIPFFFFFWQGRGRGGEIAEPHDIVVPEGGREGRREGGRKEGRKGGRKGGREGGRKEGREGGREEKGALQVGAREQEMECVYYVCLLLYCPPLWWAASQGSKGDGQAF